eukprot:TRINITY_DN3053_c0_g1_i14.p1 TRINITY_DN3053_c0_g1~~TRINITY_DN3053_c0_g1_i14.p1  ORF type:complete len:438 (-),score=100.94 TRINITY_DN3053_c0_g1_i14:303-1616(-)
MDLSSVEGLADLINSETECQRKQAFWQMSGGAEKLYQKWSSTIIKCLATVEAIIDFGEDEQIQVNMLHNILPLIGEVLDEIDAHLQDGHRGEMLRSGIHVAIVGPPNAGKSSLLNLLARRPASIVSPIKGTTRDVVEVRMDIAGYPVLVADTAGLHDTPRDEIESEGIERALQRFQSAIVRILVLDTDKINSLHRVTSVDSLLKRTTTPTTDATTATDTTATTITTTTTTTSSTTTATATTAPGTSTTITTDSVDLYLRSVEDILVRDLEAFNHSSLGFGSDQLEKTTLVVFNKIDLCQDGTDEFCKNFPTLLKNWIPSVDNSLKGVHFISCTTSRGLDSLLTNLERCISSIMMDPFQPITTNNQHVITRARHREHLAQTVIFLRGFLDKLQEDEIYLLEVAVEDLKEALNQIGKIMGRVDIEDVLDVLFKDFCIGK